LVLVGGGIVNLNQALAQTATTSQALPTPVITKLSVTSATPGTWIVITGTGLSRTQVFVDSMRVSLANILFDAAGKEVKYRVEDKLTAGDHSLYILDPQSKQSSRPVTFSVIKNTLAAPVVNPPLTVIKNVKVGGLDKGKVWFTGTSKTVSWTAAGTSKIDILVCQRALGSCLQLVSKTANDGAETVKLLPTAKTGASYVMVRKYRDDSVKAVSADFTVSAPSAFSQGKMQLASVWQAIENFLAKVVAGE
jgi:hypothetical protein